MKLRDLLGAAVLSMLASWCATACDTPVYRYAMYRWEPAAYEVYHFHSGEVDAAFTSVHEQLRAAQRHEHSPTNVAVRLVNVADDSQLQNLPREIRALRDKHTATPWTIVTNPLGIEVFQGDLDAAQANALLQAGATREELGKLLSAGHAGVFLLIPGTNAELNAAAELALAKLVGDVNSGKISLYHKPKGDDPLSANEDPISQLRHTVASLTHTRETLTEQDPWLLKSLMAVEGDLHEFVAEPMLFVIYGRGRALPPFIGKGITFDNLVDIADFITGACSCTVKEQNPGVDLLMGYNWQSAAAALAKRFGTEEGSESLGNSSQLIADVDTAEEASPAEAAPAAVGTEPASDEEEGRGDNKSPDNPNDAGAEADDTTTPEDQESITDVDPKVIERNEILANIDQRFAPREAPTAAAPAPTASPQLFVPLSLGLAVGFVMLVAVTFLVLKPL